MTFKAAREINVVQIITFSSSSSNMILRSERWSVIFFKHQIQFIGSALSTKSDVCCAHCVIRILFTLYTQKTLLARNENTTVRAKS
jgi:hypothetical protein